MHTISIDSGISSLIIGNTAGTRSHVCLWTEIDKVSLIILTCTPSGSQILEELVDYNAVAACLRKRHQKWICLQEIEFEGSLNGD